MAIVLRLCLHAVDAKGEKIRVWLSFSVLHATSPRDIILLAQRNVQQRMGAKLEVCEGQHPQLGLCVCDSSGCFLFLGAAHMEMAKVPLTKMPFVAELLRVAQEKAWTTLPGSSEEVSQRFIFLQGALVPLSDLQRLKCQTSATAVAAAAGEGDALLPCMYEAVTVTPELSGHPLDAKEPPLQRDSFTCSSTTDGAGKKRDHGSVLIHYIDFAGRQYHSVLQHADVQSLHTLMCTACQDIGAQVGCAFQPSNMRLMLDNGGKNVRALESDAAVLEALRSDNARFYLAPDSRLLSSLSPQRSDTSVHEPGLPLKEPRGNRNEIEVLQDDAPQSFGEPWALATSAATLRRLGSLSPVPTFVPNDRQSILRIRPAPVSMREEEDNARLHLASMHFRMDEMLRNHATVTLEAGRNAVYKELMQKKAILMEELTECMSAERDCQRLETLLTWLEKDVADGHKRQEKLVRALYA